MAQTILDLGRKVKAKYPGQYDDLDDLEVGRRVKAKYPSEYADFADVGAGPEKIRDPRSPLTPVDIKAPLTGVEPQSILQTAEDYATAGLEGLSNLGKGFGKGILKTSLGVSKLTNMATGGRIGVDPSVSQEDIGMAPEGTAQKIGQGVEQIGEYFLPGPVEVKALQKLSSGRPALDALFRAAISGASSAAVQTAQTGTTEGAGTAALVSGGTNLATQGIAKGLGLLGQRIERAIVKGTARDIQDGFKPENIFKHDLGGTLAQTYDKVGEKLKTTSAKLKAVLGGSKNQVDLAKIYGDTLAEYSNNPQANDALNKILQRVQFDLDKAKVGNVGQNVNLMTANLIKQSSGEMGAWLHDPNGKIMSEADRVLEEVANTFYSKMKTAIEGAAPPGAVKAINQELSELITIKNAVLRRLPVDARKELLNMGDLFALSSRQLGISGLNRVLKSGRVANTAVQASRKSLPLSVGAGAAGGAAASFIPK